MPEITVVIPTRNRWPLLSKTLAGALAQEDVAHEVIVVDDGSTDETAARLAEMNEPRVRTFRNERAHGVAEARNRGIAAARGEWVAFLDDDDLWAPRKLAEQLRAGSSPDTVLVYTAALVLDESMAVVEVLDAPEPDDLLRRILPGNFIPAGASNVMARTDAVRKVGGFEATLSQFADWDLWIRLLQLGPAAACAEPLLGYIQHPDSMLLTSGTRELRGEFDLMIERHRGVTERLGVDFDRAGFERWVAWGASRGGLRFRAGLGYLRAALMYARQRQRDYSRNSLRDSVRAVRGERLTDSGRRLGEGTPTAGADWLAAYRPGQ
jgi:glycosyltransferase involved in cell wall biosynthesis